MKKTLFALALFSAPAFCGWWNTIVDTVKSPFNAIGHSGTDHLRAQINELPAGSPMEKVMNIVNSGSGVSKAADKLLPMLSGLANGIAPGTLPVVQKALCSKADAWSGKYSVRSFNGLACFNPVVYSIAKGLCAGYEGFDESSCNKNGQSVEKALGQKVETAVSEEVAALMDSANEQEVAVLMDPANEQGVEQKLALPNENIEIIPVE